MKQPLQPELWANLTRLMTEKGLSPNDLADFMGWSSAEQFHKWRRGAYRISRLNATRLAEFLSVRMEELDPSGESFDMENRGPQKTRRTWLGKTPTVPPQPPDTSDAALARAHRTSDHGTEEGRVADQYWKSLATTYEFFVDDLNLDEHGRQELVKAMRTAAKAFAEQQEKRGAKKAAGE